MNKVELYNKIVNVYKATGQGTSMIISHSIGRDLINELVEDGLVKIIRQNYNHLPDDEWICLTKGYCVEEDYIEKDTESLTFMRLYIGLNELISLGGFKFTSSNAIKDPEFMKRYVIWLEKNKDKLAEISTIEHLDETIGDTLKDDIVEYIKSRTWYSKNDIVSVCLKKMSDINDDMYKQISILTELINLKNTSSETRERYSETLNENIKEKEELEKELKIRNRIERWLLDKDGNANIQSII
jgi:hypothetical protein